MDWVVFRPPPLPWAEKLRSGHGLTVPADWR